GARVRRVGRLPTREPVLVICNHQSLTDILQITLLATPFVPAFVTRKRYERFVPLVSASMRLLGCPIVDPKRDPAAAVEAIRKGARELPHGIAIFPEGHRSRDGRVLPFRLAGAGALRAAAPGPVPLVRNERVWRWGPPKNRLFRFHGMDASSELSGPSEPPPEPAERVAFLRSLRERLVEAIERHRAGAAA